MKEDYKLFEIFTGSYHYKTSKFKTFNLLPNISFIRDAQFEEGFVSTETNTIYPGTMNYSIVLDWWKWYIEFELNIKTNKWMNNETNNKD